MGEIFLLILFFICVYFLIQMITGKLKLKSKSDKYSSPDGVGDSSISDCSGGDCS